MRDERKGDKVEVLIQELLLKVDELHSRMDGNGGPMTRAEAAAYLKCHPKTLYNWAVRDGRIPYSQPGDRGGLRFMKEDLDAFLGACKVGDTSRLGAT